MNFGGRESHATSHAQDGAENSVVTLRTAVLQWTNEMPWLQGADVFDRRRAILFIAGEGKSVRLVRKVF